MLGSAAIFVVAYIVYGSWLAKQWGVDPKRPTPAQTMKDGIDYVPTRPIVLLGHHFSSIAGAGPIVGPISAAVFGWIPVCLWIIIGSVFFGGVHDYGSMVASLRHKGQSIGQVIDKNVGHKAKLLFAFFAWITMMVVVAAFANIVASTFVANPGTGTASILFMFLAVLFGMGVYRSGFPLLWASIVGVACMFGAFYLGHLFPISLSKEVWLVCLFAYVFVASIVPVWILLQPRDYLNSFLLYAMMIAAMLGILFYSPSMQIDGFVAFDLGNGNWLFPVLFVTVACGAISGFHSMVSSGTSSKQLDNEKNAKLIGYGSMLIEGMLAICATISVAYVAADQLPALLKGGGPVNVFSQGIATFMTSLGLDFAMSKEFVALTISAFALTTLDTATRLGRFVFQELLAPKLTAVEAGQQQSQIVKFLSNRYVATIVTIAISWYMASGSYLTIWPIFGTANQLLAALALLAVAAWLKREGRKTFMVTIPMAFMFVVTFTSLGQLIYANFGTNWLIVSLSVILGILALALAVETYRVFRIENTHGLVASQQE